MTLASFTKIALSLDGAVRAHHGVSERDGPETRATDINIH
jgi:hypothetical protein